KHIIDNGQPLIINRNAVEERSKYDNTVLVGEGAKSLVFVPIYTKDELTGIISLQDLDKEDAFTESDVTLLSTLANSMSVALENALLFDENRRRLAETEQRTAELAVINSVQEGLAKELDIQSIYEMVGEKIRQIFHAQVIDIVTYDKKSNLIEDRYAFEKGDRTLLGPRIAQGFRQHIIKSGQLLLINENYDEVSVEYNNSTVIGEQPKSMLLVPMIAGSEVTGVISLQNLDEENAFSESDVSLLTTLANSMSVALENARLFDETNRLLAETEQRTAELSVINSVQEGLAKELEIQAIYELVGEKMRQIFNAQVIDIVTYDRAANLIEDRYAYEKGDRTLIGQRAPKGFRKHVIENAQVLVINSNLENEKPKYGQSVIIGEAAKSIVLVPMISGNRVNGVISLQNIDQENAFSDSDISLLTTLSNSMSAALENARLFDETIRLLKETEQRTAELSVINSVQEGLARELNIHGIYKLVGDRIGSLFPDTQTLVIRVFDSKYETENFEYFVEKGEDLYVDPKPLMWASKVLVQSKQPILINRDYEKTAKKYGNSVVTKGEPPKSALFVPMMVGDTVKGTVSLQNVDRENAFTEAHVRLLTTLTNSMSVALENARLFDETNRLLAETEQRTAELSVINSVQEGLAQELDIDGIYELVGEKMREIFNAQVIDIATYDREANVIQDRYSFEKGDRTLLGPREPQGFRQHIIKSGQLLLINENYDTVSGEFNNSTIIGAQPKSMVLVPMIAGSEVTGVISLQNLDEENAFNESDLRLLTTITNSMSVALESARLFNETTRLLSETEQRTAELSVINSVQEGLAKELDIDGIYELVGEKLRQIFNAQVIDIVIFDRENNLIEDRYSFEKGDRTLLGPREPKGFRKHVIETGSLLVFNENSVEMHKKYDNEVFIGDPAKSLVFVPMIAGNEVTGVISLQNVDEENAFGEADLRLLSTITNSMSVALESARLFNETNRLLTETKKRTAELSVINSVQEGLAKELDINGIYELVGEKMRDIFNAQVIDIVTYDKNNNTIEDCYSYEKGDRSLLGPRPLTGFRKYIIESGKTLLINKDADAQRLKYHNSVLVGQGAKSLVFVPIVAGDGITGVISLQNLDEENAFSDSDVNLLTTFSNSMSVALENARLFDETARLLAETEQRASEMQTVNQISGALVAQLEFDALIHLVGEQMKNTFKADIVYLALYDRKNDVLNFPYVFGDTIESRPFANGITEKIILNKEPLLVNHTLEEVYDALNATKQGKTVESYIGVPIVVGKDAIGVISVQSTKQDNVFTENDQRLLTTIAANVGIAMNNAEAYQELQAALTELKAAQEQLVQAEKMASLGELTAGIAHEIQNPLNFVNNFSEVNTELIGEMCEEINNGNIENVIAIANDIKENQDKITHHGKRAGGIVKSMLHHSRTSTGVKELTDVNALADEYLRLAYHGLRAKDKSFNATMKTDFDKNLGKINIIAQDIGRVILNLITNAFYTVDEKKRKQGDSYDPTVSVSTKKLNGKIEVSVSDNGNGIPQKVMDKIFQPFFTTKPTGQGTGLGLSLSYDIIKAHGGELKVETVDGEGTQFTIILSE
ncbi:MAG: GAF domain-containing protein, partial [Bacteroidetes bacterium]|nr:GAF domain-containing protein [Bacteroidota bacterium]